jgi:HlyD family secretion protein
MVTNGKQGSSSKKRWWVITGVIAVIVVIAVVFFLTRTGQGSTEYFTAAVTEGPIRNTVSATGVLQTVVTVQVGSQVSGQIQALYADFNSVVHRGQLLAKLDPRNFQSQLDNAQASLGAVKANLQRVESDLKVQQANLDSAKANLDAARVARDNAEVILKRYKELSSSGVLAQNDLDTAQATYDGAVARYNQAAASITQNEAQLISGKAQIQQARAQVAQAEADLDRSKINLEYCDIYSPVDGVVVSRSVDVGQTVAASLQAPTLFIIANDLTKMQVNASIDEADIGKISPTVETTFTVDAYPNDNFTGRVAEIRLNPQTVQNVVTYSVIINVDNPDLKLKPGMTANISMVVDQRDKVLKIPNAALRYLPPEMTRDKMMALLRTGGGPGGKPEAGAPAGTKTAQGAASPRSTTTGGGAPAAAASAKKGGWSGRAPQGAPATARAIGPAGSSRAGAVAATEHMPVGPDPGASILAPGQDWDPNDKIQFPAPRNHRVRPAIIWVLGADGKPAYRKVLLGITDGISTQLVKGELKAGDKVIIGDTTQELAADSPTGVRSPLMPVGRGGPRR